MNDLKRDMEYFDIEYKKKPTIYYKREHLTSSYENRRIDLITISSKENILKEKEPWLDSHLFPNRAKEQRCLAFDKKKPIIF